MSFSVGSKTNQVSNNNNSLNNNKYKNEKS